MTVEQTTTSQKRRHLVPSLKVPAWRTLYLMFLVGLGICYWFFVWLMERIDLATYQLPIELPFQLPPIVISFTTLFLPRVLRHFIPVIIGWLIAYEMAANLLLYLYDLPDRRRARRNLNQLGNPSRARGRPLTVTAQNLEQLREESVLLRAGGPGLISIPVGQVAVTEHNGHFYRILDAGFHALDSFEYVHDVLDLRAQHRNDPEVRLLSREGLEVCTSSSVTFRISTGGQPASPMHPYPLDSTAVKNLAYSQINLPGNKASTWEGTALGIVSGILRKTVFAFSLDELLEDSQTEVGSHLTIRQQVEREARQSLAEKGIELMRLRIGRFRFPDDVTEQHIEYWSTYWDTRAQMAGTEGEAVAIEELEMAKAEAEIDTIKTIVDGVDQARQQGYGGTAEEIVALRLLEILEKLARQSQDDIPLPNQMLPQIQALQEQLTVTEDKAND
ncbi:MAG: SPFH domain-containing protein [Candidatus Promineifilaceae bacterium]|nr:SPFH domain-containing protein [Candidatus Promineifilaceae bacterium]